jgi:hypothetical protein
MYIYICMYGKRICIYYGKRNLRKTSVCLLQTENGNGNQKYIIFGRQTINGDRQLLFQQTCPLSMHNCKQFRNVDKRDGRRGRGRGWRGRRERAKDTEDCQYGPGVQYRPPIWTSYCIKLGLVRCLNPDKQI